MPEKNLVNSGLGRKILVNGAAGRIGRAVTYELVKLEKEFFGNFADPYLHRPFSYDLVAINDPVGTDKIVESLSGKDPVHGKYDWNVKKLDDKTIELNGTKIQVYAEKDLTKIPFKEMGIWLVEECSGFYGDDKKDPKKSLANTFLDLGVEKVIQSYPASSADITLIMGANQQLYDAQKHKLISNGSCTTKAMVAPLQLLLDQGIGIEALLMDTAHAATNSQTMLESLDQILTHKTGAAKSVGEVIPSLKGKMDGLAFRVPTTDGSFANMYFVASSYKKLTADIVNEMFKEHYQDEKYMDRLGIFEEQEAGTGNDIVGRTENGVVILSKTRVFELPFKDLRYLEMIDKFEKEAGHPIELTDIPQPKNTYLIGLISGYDNEAAPPKDQVLLTKYICDKQ